MSRKFDIIIFGASGFTGQCLVEKAVELHEKKLASFSWAIAGRSERKLDETLHKISKDSSLSQKSILKNVVKIIADVADPQSLRDMARQAKLVINVVGPYRFFGEPMVKACLDEGTHHVDLSGEPLFLEKTQLAYHEQAESKGVYIIGSCGFDSIPGDCGATLLQQKFDGDLNSIEMYMEMIQHSGRGRIHYATWQSAIHGVASGHELGPLRRALFTQRPPKPDYPIPKRDQLHYSDVVKGWCFHFPGSDKSVIQRSQYHFYTKEGKTPTQISTFIKVPSFWKAVLTVIFGSIFLKLAGYKIGRYLLETFPRFFSTGIATHEGPSAEDMKALEFKLTWKGEGWARTGAGNGSDKPKQKHTGPPNKQMYLRTSFFDPCYGATGIMALAAAITVIQETEKLPSKGGVYTPGAAFAKTALISKLKWAGIHYSVENS